MKLEWRRVTNETREKLEEFLRRTHGPDVIMPSAETTEIVALMDENNEIYATYGASILLRFGPLVVDDLAKDVTIVEAAEALREVFAGEGLSGEVFVAFDDSGEDEKAFIAAGMVKLPNSVFVGTT